VGYFFGNEFCGRNWRFIMIIPLLSEVLRLALLLARYRMETPRYIATQNKYKLNEALETELASSSKPLVEKDPAYDAIFSNYKKLYNEDVAKILSINYLNTFRRDNEKEAGLADLVKPYYRLQFIVALVLNLLNQLTGMNVITVFSNNILKRCGVDEPTIYTQIMGFIAMGAIGVVVFSVKIVGKRNLFIWGLFGQALGYCIFLAGVAYLKSSLVIGGMYVCMFTYSISLGGIVFGYNSDILPPVGSFTVSLIQWALGCVLMGTASSIEASIGVSAMFFFAQLSAVIGGIFYIGYGVETVGKSNKQIAKEFQNKRFYD